MATYVISDVHGCHASLLALLDRIGWRPGGSDRLVFVGDLVNSGPDSLAVLRWAAEHEDELTAVLGNHDLHLLAVSVGARPLRAKDTFSDVLEAPDNDELLAWLRHRPLLHEEEDGTLVVHAGLLPEWTVSQAHRCAREVERALRDEEGYRDFFGAMYGNEPRQWRLDLSGEERRRLTVNATTRMRALQTGGALDFRYKGELGDMPRGLQPWFRLWRQHHPERKLVFGHWSAIGYHREGEVHGLDTGCVWGRTLSALRLEDEQLFQQPRVD